MNETTGELRECLDSVKEALELLERVKAQTIWMFDDAGSRHLVVLPLDLPLRDAIWAREKHLMSLAGQIAMKRR